MSLDLLLSAPWLICFDNEPVEDDPVDPVDPTDPGEPEPKTLSMTQAELDEIVTKRTEQARRQSQEAKKQYKKLEESYKTLLQDKTLSDDQRTSFEEQLENIRAQQRTKEENLKAQQKKEAEKYTKELEKLTSERDKYQKMFSESTIERAITDAASNHDGFNSELFIAYLGPRTKLVEQAGKMVPMVEFQKPNEDTGELELHLQTPDEAVAAMKEDTDKYGGMFKSNIARGVGTGTAPGNFPAGRIDPTKISPEEYMRLRKERGREAFGLTR